ncbi:MAG: hypothetical protein WC154_08910 [Candidatus Izemoplasmatales bacterium]
MKVVYRLSSVLFLLVMVVLSYACTGKTSTDTTGENNSIAGEYIVDITSFGMPLEFYLKIDQDNKFYLSPDRNYTTDKGNGTVGSSGDTYMLIYSDSTTEEPKNTTFKFEEKNIVFETNLIYGTSNLPATKEDEDDPNITYQLLGRVLLYEDYFGEYAGGHTVSAMGSNVDYEYYLTLGPGRIFNFVSNFNMGGSDYIYEEKGYFDVESDVLTLKIDEEEVIGSFSEDKDLTIGVKASEMGSREERLLRVATTASCASVYYGFYQDYTGETLNYETEIELILDKFGGYILKIDNSTAGEITETGAFNLDEGDLEFTPSDSDNSYEGVLANYVLEAEVLVKDGVRKVVKLYCNTIQGVFTAAGEDEEENSFEAFLELSSDGTFSFTVKDKNLQLIVDETGTFTTNRMMFTQLVLTGEKIYTLVVSEVGLNVNIEIEQEKEIGFILIKE